MHNWQVIEKAVGYENGACSDPYVGWLFSKWPVIERAQVYRLLTTGQLLRIQPAISKGAHSDQQYWLRVEKMASYQQGSKGSLLATHLWLSAKVQNSSDQYGLLVEKMVGY
jgi:hypothetical protein